MNEVRKSWNRYVTKVAVTVAVRDDAEKRRALPLSNEVRKGAFDDYIKALVASRGQA